MQVCNCHNQEFGGSKMKKKKWIDFHQDASPRDTTTARKEKQSKKKRQSVCQNKSRKPSVKLNMIQQCDHDKISNKNQYANCSTYIYKSGSNDLINLSESETSKLHLIQFKVLNFKEMRTCLDWFQFQF